MVSKSILMRLSACMIIPWLGCLPWGCTHTLHGQGEFGVKQSTEWAFYQKTAPITVPPATSSMTIEADSILELFNEPGSTPAPVEDTE